MDPITIAAIVQGASSLFGAGKGIQSMQKSRKIKPEYYAYGDARLQGQESPYAKQMLGQAQMALNARTPFAAAQQRGILGSQANAMAQAQRSVTDPSQILAMTAALQGGTDKALAEQGMQEQEAYQRSLSNLMAAQQVMISEGDKVYQDRMRKFAMDQERKDALQQAGAQSVVGGLSNLASSIIGAKGASDYSKYLNTMKAPADVNIGSKAPDLSNIMLLSNLTKRIVSNEQSNAFKEESDRLAASRRNIGKSIFNAGSSFIPR